MSRQPDDETALAIELTVLCKELHVLPKAGGLLDQDPYHIHLLKAGLSALREKAAKEANRR